MSGSSNKKRLSGDASSLGDSSTGPRVVVESPDDVPGAASSALGGLGHSTYSSTMNTNNNNNNNNEGSFEGDGGSAQSLAAVRALLVPEYGLSLAAAVLAESHRLNNTPASAARGGVDILGGGYAYQLLSKDAATQGQQQQQGGRRLGDSEYDGCGTGSSISNNNYYYNNSNLEDGDAEDEEVFSVAEWTDFAARKIQSAFRMHRAREAFKQTTAAASTIQRAFRRHTATRDVARLRQTSLADAYDRAVFDYYATVIQARVRGVLSRRDHRRGNYYAQKHYIQSVTDAAALLRQVSEEADAMDNKARAAREAAATRDAYTSATASVHHLMSTASVSGVYRPPAAAASRDTDLGTKVEDDIEANARARRRPEIEAEYAAHLHDTNVKQRSARKAAAAAASSGRHPPPSSGTLNSTSGVTRSYRKSDRDVLPYGEVYSRDEERAVSELQVPPAGADHKSSSAPPSAASSHRLQQQQQGDAPFLSSSLPPIRGANSHQGRNNNNGGDDMAGAAATAPTRPHHPPPSTKTKNMRTGVHTLYGTRKLAPADSNNNNGADKRNVDHNAQGTKGVAQVPLENLLAPRCAWESPDALPPQRPLVSPQDATVTTLNNNNNATNATTAASGKSRSVGAKKKKDVTNTDYLIKDDTTDSFNNTNTNTGSNAKASSSSFKRKFNTPAHDCTTDDPFEHRSRPYPNASHNTQSTAALIEKGDSKKAAKNKKKTNTTPSKTSGANRSDSLRRSSSVSGGGRKGSRQAERAAMLAAAAAEEEEQEQQSRVAVSYPLSYYRDVGEEGRVQRSVDNKIAQSLHRGANFKTTRHL